MKSQPVSALFLLSLIALVASSCAPAPAAAPQPTSAPAAASSTLGIIAEGRLEPLRYVNLSPAAGGSVSQLNVKEGDTIEPGQVLAVIQGDRARTLEQAQASAAAELADANQAVRKAQRAHDDFAVPRKFAGMTPTQAAAQALTTLDAARQAFEPYKGTQRQSLKTIRPWFRTWTPSIWVNTGEYSGEAKELKKQLDVAWVDYRRALLWLQLDSDLESAQARLDQAQKDNDSLQDASLAEDTAGARAALATAEMRAPFGGAVTNVDLKVGQFVTPGKPVITVADFSKWLVKTTDLTEIDVVNVKEGDPVTVALDAIPGVKLKGYVFSIGQSYSERQGDIVYEVTVLLTDTHPAMRWGMTAEVSIAPGE